MYIMSSIVLYSLLCKTYTLMRAGKKIQVWVSTPDYEYLRDRKVSPTDLMRASIRMLRSHPNEYTSDNFT